MSGPVDFPVPPMTDEPAAGQPGAAPLSGSGGAQLPAAPTTTAPAAGPAPVAPRVTAPRSGPGLLVAVSLWRLALAGCALYGFGAAMTGDYTGAVNWRNLGYFSQWGSLLVGVVALGGLLSPLWNHGAYEGRRGVLRGLAVTCTTLIAIVFGTLLGADYSSTASLFEHLVTPIVALIDWLAVGRNAARVQWWWPAGYLVVVLAYLPTYLATSEAFGHPLYGFLDPDADDFWVWVVALLAGFGVLALVLLAAARLTRRWLPADRPPGAQPAFAGGR